MRSFFFVDGLADFGSIFPDEFSDETKKKTWNKTWALSSVCVCVWTGERVTGASSRVIIISFYWSGRISKFTSGRRWSVTPEKKEEEEGKK